MGKPLDLTGQRFGKLVAIKRLDEKVVRTYLWECKCDCGNICKVSVTCLRNGNTKSCECAKYDGLKKYNEKNSENNKINIGEKFGKLTVIKDLGLKPQYNGAKKNRRWYKCKCDCGNEIEVYGNRLKTGNIISCEKCRVSSKGELQIQTILKDNHINFLHDTVFLPLYKETGRKLRFDFIVYDENFNILRFIEYDGRQHTFGPDTNYWGNTSSLEEIQERDLIKNNYCLKHNYILIRIPYTIKNITLDDIMSNKYIVK